MTRWRNVYQFACGKTNLGFSEYDTREEAESASRRFIGAGIRTMYRVRIAPKVAA